MAATAAGPPITVIGAGLAGSLAALALARRGAAVTLVAPAAAAGAADGAGSDAATALSYGSLLGRGAAGDWKRLERLHGRLGWQPAGLVLHGPPWPLSALPPGILALTTAALPFSRVDAPALTQALPRALAQAGVRWRQQSVAALLPRAGGGWRLRMGTEGDAELAAERVLLAAGAGCRALWPQLPERLRVSWAGVLTLSELPEGHPWLEQVRRGRIVQPRNWRRPALEARAAGLEGQEWIVDAGLAPWGKGGVVGQISLVRPGPGAGDPPDPAWMEARLREGIEPLDPELARLEAPYRQVPVPFCHDGRPLSGPVAGAPGLWAFTGFSGAFGLVPAAAERLAGEMLATAAREGEPAG